MRQLLFGFLLSMTANAFGQQMPDYGVNRIRLVDASKSIVAEILPINTKPKAKPTLFYSWYGANLIHSTQGGFSGRLLNGSYTEYFPNKNLEEQGQYKNGLKNGPWKQWNEDGTLIRSVSWKKGIVVIKKPFFLWKKLSFIKKMFSPSNKDTLKMPPNKK